ncbi:MAG: hypothetical protein PHX97_04060 [Dehalococcoidales bacterium]|nr:hypothetical protein [Dehalococcoidales bacterium]
MLAGNSHNSNAMLATRNVQQAGHWISQDILMADPEYTNISKDDDPATPDPAIDPDTTTDVLTVYWTEYTAWGYEKLSNKYRVTYNINENNELIRYVFEVEKEFEIYGNTHEDGYPPMVPEDEDDRNWVLIGKQLISQYIDSVNFSIDDTNGHYVVNIKCFVPGFRPGEAEKKYEIEPRLS